MKKHLFIGLMITSSSYAFAQLPPCNELPQPMSIDSRLHEIGYPCDDFINPEPNPNPDNPNPPTNPPSNSGSLDFTSNVKPIGFETWDTFLFNGDLIANYGMSRTSGTVDLSGWGGLKFITNKLERMSITNNGNVGIGNLNPKTKLDIDGAFTLSGNHANLDSTIPTNEVANLNHLKNSGKLLIGWNISPGLGETVFISNRGGGSDGGFHFYDYTNTGQINNLLKINSNGNVLVNGKLEAKEVKITLSPTADFVFEEDYNLPTLKEVENHIKEKKHLLEIPSAAEMEKAGVDVGVFQIKLLQKIEELTLYIIDQNKKIEKLEEQVESLHQ